MTAVRSGGAAVWWSVYPLGAVGALHAGPGARLGLLERWLDVLVDLGVDGLALGPVFASETHGYDTTDHFAVDPRLGTGPDLDRLLAAAHERGLRVLLDGVFNHVGASFGRSEWWSGVFEGHDILKGLDHSREDVRAYVVDVMCHWLERGADGWRLDAAYSVPTDFWAAVLPRVRARFPSCFVVGEVIHGDYARFVQRSGVDSVTQYELWKAIWSSLRDGNLFELAHALERHDALLDSFVPLTFVDNHDVTRIASQVGPDLLPLAFVVLLTVAGTPCLYAGDEQGLTGVKEDRAGGDDAVRPELGTPPEPGPVYRLLQELIALRRRHPLVEESPVERLHLTNGQLVYRCGGLTVGLNCSPAAAVVPVVGELEPYGWRVLEA